MATIANYTVIHAGSITLPKSNGDIDHDFGPFSAPDVNAGNRSILTFRVIPLLFAGFVTLKMTLNGRDIFTPSFKNEENDRSLHEVVGSNILSASNNTLTVTRVDGLGSVVLADLVLHFQANL